VRCIDVTTALAESVAVFAGYIAVGSEWIDQVAGDQFLAEQAAALQGNKPDANATYYTSAARPPAG
jgi:hypothetical protein